MAQALAIRNEVQSITPAQSLQSVQTLLKAGIGCITYMRDLLPEDNFEESHFTSADDSISSEAIMSPISPRPRKNVSPFKIMTITKGYTVEADRMINYLEQGIFDALEKQYLRSFIFGIYLDSKEPTNIVEAYTFNFRYQSIPGTDTLAPVLSLGDNRSRTIDPVGQSVKEGKLPTVKDVKRAVKTLIKTLITSMTQMDSLPKRRYATFKLLYMDHTPEDYEPPHFHAGDFERDKWYFMTHDLDEVPDRWSVGKLDTGHHKVDVSVASIATFLPSSTTLHDHAAFAGLASTNESPPTFTPAEHAALRSEQAAKQAEDASTRNVVWAVEEDRDRDRDRDLDGECDEDPDYVKTTDGSYVLREEAMAPVGIRDAQGIIQPLAAQPAAEMNVDTVGGSETVHYGATRMDIPDCLDDLLASKNVRTVAETQSISGREMSVTPRPQRTSSTAIHRSSSFSPSSSSLPEFNKSGEQSVEDIDNQMRRIALNGDTIDDTIMLDMETQIESIESFGEESQVTQKLDPPAEMERDLPLLMECECGIDIEDDYASTLCEGPCRRWFHIWCMGYHSATDARLPCKFICFDCRVKADLSWELIRVDLYPTMIAKFKELALFRRAIKVAEQRGPGNTPAEFAKKMGVDNSLARQLFKRLEVEGFILDKNAKQTRAQGKGKGKQAKRKAAPKYIFNLDSHSKQEYLDYFNPEHEVESRLLGLPQAKPKSGTAEIAHSHAPTSHATGHSSPFPPSSEIHSQTQDESMPPSPPPVSKRPAETPLADSRPKKKVKISLAFGVDLAE